MLEVTEGRGQWNRQWRVTRREEVGINRLRSGHTSLTHGYFMENRAPQIPSICQFCRDAIMTVKHLVITCPSLTIERHTMKVFRENRNVSLATILNNEANTTELLGMLKRINVYSAI